jgi:serine protease
MLRKSRIVVCVLAGVTVTACVGAGDDSADPTSSSSQLVQGQSRVWIHYQPSHKQGAKSAVNAANGQLHHEFDDLDAVVATVPTAALTGLAHNPNVASIEDDEIRVPFAASPGESPPYGVGMVEATAMQNAGYTGTGTKVCIIDSGLQIRNSLPVAASKVTFVPGNLPPDVDKFGHGTHVAGTIAGTPFSIGVAPGANLVIVRVFGDDGVWAYSSTLVQAAKYCEQYGAKIVSMSLGGSRSVHAEQTQFDGMATRGILSIAAAGNDGNTRTSYPAGYSSVVSVAAIDSAKAHATFSQVNKDVELSAPGVHVWSMLPYLEDVSASVGTTTYVGGHMEGAPRTTGTTAALVDGGLCDATSATYAGKVVLCQRGTIAFVDKVNNAQNSGAVAAIVYNNVSGGFGGTLGAGVTSAIPAITISMEDGTALKASSLGLNTTVKDAVDPNQNGYDAWDGTSMATPHVSGVAALVWGACPGATAAQVRAALTSSALDLGTAGRDNTFGFGLVRACRAAKALCNVPATCP